MLLFDDVSGTELDGVHCEFPSPDLPGMYYAGLDEFETGDLMGRIVEGEEYVTHSTRPTQSTHSTIFITATVCNPPNRQLNRLNQPTQPSALNPQPSTLNPQPSTLNPQPSTLNPQL